MHLDQKLTQAATSAPPPVSAAAPSGPGPNAGQHISANSFHPLTVAFSAKLPCNGIRDYQRLWRRQEQS